MFGIDSLKRQTCQVGERLKWHTDWFVFPTSIPTNCVDRFRSDMSLNIVSVYNAHFMCVCVQIMFRHRQLQHKKPSALCQGELFRPPALRRCYCCT